MKQQDAEFNEVMQGVIDRMSVLCEGYGLNFVLSFNTDENSKIETLTSYQQVHEVLNHLDANRNIIIDDMNRNQQRSDAKSLKEQYVGTFFVCVDVENKPEGVIGDWPVKGKPYKVLDIKCSLMRTDEFTLILEGLTPGGIYEGYSSKRFIPSSSFTNYSLN